MLGKIRNRFLLTILFFALSIIFFNVLVQRKKLYHDSQEIDEDDSVLMMPHIFNNYTHEKWHSLSFKQIDSLSTLGRILYLGEDPPKLQKPLRNYTILIWKYGHELELRHIKRYTKQRYDPFEKCMVRNCDIQYNSSGLPSADLVVFDLYRTKSIQQLPLHKERNPKQLWAFLTKNSPFDTFKFPHRTVLSKFNNLFNWSMTYSMRSDVPIPYGRTTLLQVGEKGVVQNYQKWNEGKNQNVLLAIVGSTCQSRNRRWDYVRELEKHIKIDVYGKCGTKRCRSDGSDSDGSSNFANDCDEISQYKFYLALENANCDEYITERVWWYGYQKNAIPIVMGGSRESYHQLLPPDSYISVDQFARPQDLATFVMYLNRTPNDLQTYFNWKKYFRVVDEHGLFHTKSALYCRMCEALNYNRRELKVYRDLKKFWSTTECHPSWNYRKLEDL